MTTYAAALRAAQAALAGRGVEHPALDARLLLAAAAGLEGAALVARDRETVPPLALSRLDAHLQRRLAGEPLARIFGEKEFWGLPLKIGAATLVPRPETETLVEAVLAEARRRGPERLTICDLGTGCGAIIVALLAELSQATGVATDLSCDALAIAAENARRHGVADRVSFEQGEFAAVPEGAFDLVVSNPPYVRSDAIAGLPCEVRGFDPHLALDGGTDGCAAYRTILGRAAKLLVEGGMIALETGYDQSARVAAMCREAGLDDVCIRRDLAGNGRVVTARRSAVRHRSRRKKALGKVDRTG